jgi:coenzyme F420-reducing hydrogenase delta subunit
MQIRSDGRPFEGEAVVDPNLCVACGICAGACPTSTPFRRLSDLVPGIDLPDRSMAAIRADAEAEGARIAGPARIMIFGCVNAAVATACRSDNVGVVSLNCSGQLPPSFIDSSLARNSDGVIIAGCMNSCHNRFGTRWTADRLACTRDPHLRARVPRERLVVVWAGRLGASMLRREIEKLVARLAHLGPFKPRARISGDLAVEEKLDA